ncbi:hypothetical protein [Haemophilus haemolyticus]|uniref:hypothetical protein n=1 Tax=Haemophilus haemolyticus TaxID=726 RepID=UPI001863D627|nr:hypothetical protein [Haemophilus haemolyticus]
MATFQLNYLMKKKIRDICYEETKYLPENTEEEREKSNLELIKCLRKKEKEFGVR